MINLYDDVEFEIRILKTKDMPCSQQKFESNSKLGLHVGIMSVLQSALDAGIMTEDDLKLAVETVLETRKKGARNKVIYKNMPED